MTTDAAKKIAVFSSVILLEDRNVKALNTSPFSLDNEKISRLIAGVKAVTTGIKTKL